MHVLRRPHDLHRAALATVAAAVLAIVLTLAIAGGLSDLKSGPAAGGVPSRHANVNVSAISPLTSIPFTASPFTGLSTKSTSGPGVAGPH